MQGRKTAKGSKNVLNTDHIIINTALFRLFVGDFEPFSAGKYRGHFQIPIGIFVRPYLENSVLETSETWFSC